MSRVKALPDIQSVGEWEQVRRYVAMALKELVDTVNGRLEFGSNVFGKVVDVNFTAANTEVAVSHGLGKTPIGYLPLKMTAATTVYDGTSTNTSNTIYLRSTQVSNTKLVILG